MLKIERIYTVIFVFIFACTLNLFFPTRSAATAERDQHYFETVRERLVRDGFDSEKIQRLYNRPGVNFEADGVTLFFTYSEAKVDYDQFANDWSIRKAKTFMEKYNHELSQTEQQYGVDSQIITAILLVETGLGTTVGKRSALNTLSTLASLKDREVRNMLWEMIPDSKKIPRKQFEKKADLKSGWAYQELKAFLTYAFREGLDPAEIPGSIAGAVGFAQFMPSNILAYGRDGNNDGTVDLLNRADSIASIAYFLKRHGWRPGINREKAEKIIYHYNHSRYYVATILKIANLLKG